MNLSRMMRLGHDQVSITDRPIPFQRKRKRPKSKWRPTSLWWTVRLRVEFSKTPSLNIVLTSVNWNQSLNTIKINLRRTRNWPKAWRMRISSNAKAKICNPPRSYLSKKKKSSTNRRRTISSPRIFMSSRIRRIGLLAPTTSNNTNTK